MTPSRVVHHEDALAWLARSGPLDGCSIITSMPDRSEFPSLTLDQWKQWFIDAAKLVLAKCPDEGVTVFFQTDVKHEGVWVDKGHLVQRAADEAGHDQLWHKIVCRVPAGVATFGRPSYSHLICFGRRVRADLAKSSPDVLPAPGETTWTRGMGVEACLLACRFVLANTRTRAIVDPFCGHGTALAAANFLGMDAIGVELGGKRARTARALTLVEVPLEGGGSRMKLIGQGRKRDEPAGAI